MDRLRGKSFYYQLGSFSLLGDENVVEVRAAVIERREIFAQAMRLAGMNLWRGSPVISSRYLIQPPPPLAAATRLSRDRNVST